MSNTLSNIKLIDLIPSNLKNDPDVIAAIESYEIQFKFINDLTPRVLTIADIQNATSDVLDHLAAQMNLDFYDTSLPLADKKDLVENGYIVQYQKGTKFAVERALSAKYTDTFVEEWFDYGGDPYYFRINTDIVPSPSVLSDIVATVNRVKNVRSVLESVFYNGSFRLGTVDGEIDINEGLADAGETQGGRLAGGVI